jgi:ATP-binding cassette subfamily B protein
MDIEPDIQDAKDAVSVKNLEGDIAFENVSFHYESNKEQVLKNINLQVAAGEYVALVGASGVGKTTLCSLIPRFYEVTEGAIKIDGMDIRKMKQADLRSQIGIVQQDVYLFAGNILDNIRYGKPDATDEELLHVLKTVDLYDHVMSLGLQLETAVNENGNNFSQGQLQRLSIARALLRDSEIIIMDEATSALDVETEKTVLSNIMVSNPKKICIITTHRESMLKYCDRIYKITANGELTEC